MSSTSLVDSAIHPSFRLDDIRKPWVTHLAAPYERVPSSRELNAWDTQARMRIPPEKAERLGLPEPSYLYLHTRYQPPGGGVTLHLPSFASGPHVANVADWILLALSAVVLVAVVAGGTVTGWTGRR